MPPAFIRSRFLSAAMIGMGVLLVGGIAVVADSPSVTFFACLTPGGTLHQVTTDAAQQPVCLPNETAVIWNQVGPQGPAGPQGLQGIQGPPGQNGVNGTNGVSVTSGPASTLSCPNGGSAFVSVSGTTYACNGAPGKDGANGTNGTNGTNGNNGVSVTSTALGAGDPNCPAGGTKFISASGTTFACNGLQGPAGPALASISSLNGTPCTTSAGSSGTVGVSTLTDNTISLKCVAPTPPPTTSCTHLNGVGQTYSDCVNPLGTPGVASTYNATMADEARRALSCSFFLGCGSVTLSEGAAGCGGSSPDSLFWTTTVAGGEAVVWQYAGSLAGHVHAAAGSTSLFCPLATDPTWN